jgi:valyl-tRNA synthetase
MIKPRLTPDAEPASRLAAQSTLVYALDGVLRLMHPIMPFISEALWQRLPVPAGMEREESLVIARWPVSRPGRRDRAAEIQMNELMELISTLRTIRSDYDVPPATSIEAKLSNLSEPLETALEREARALRRLARAEVTLNGTSSEVAGAHAVLRGGTELLVPLSGVIDLDKERERLRNEIARLDGQIRATDAKLGNEQFVNRAPAEVVEREREKGRSFRNQRDQLAGKLQALA